ncbi:unnamed protein product [Closterium sp. Yama58-4]|nr:unnamed protein product [Closterium sp. Yama58-4]
MTGASLNCATIDARTSCGEGGSGPSEKTEVRSVLAFFVNGNAEEIVYDPTRTVGDVVKSLSNKINKDEISDLGLYIDRHCMFINSSSELPNVYPYGSTATGSVCQGMRFDGGVGRELAEWCTLEEVQEEAIRVQKEAEERLHAAKTEMERDYIKAELKLSKKTIAAQDELAGVQKELNDAKRMIQEHALEAQMKTEEENNMHCGACNFQPLPHSHKLQVQRLQAELSASKEDAAKYMAQKEALEELVKQRGATAAASMEEIGGEQMAVELRKAYTRVDELQASETALKTRVKDLEQQFLEERDRRQRLHNEVEDLKGGIRAIARCRPLQKGHTGVLTCRDKHTVLHRSRDGTIPKYSFYHVYGPDDPQTKVFESIEGFIQSACDGYNVCIFAYGQTGSGKTYTMIGSKEEPGMIPLGVQKVFSVIEGNPRDLITAVHVYMLEVYQDKVRDLLDPTLKTVEVSLQGPRTVVLKNETRVEITSATELEKLVEQSLTRRVVAQTRMNEANSRSHVVLCLNIATRDEQTGEIAISKLSFVDLAGSEKQSQTEAEGMRLAESNAINLGLLTLHKVIRALNEKTLPPYREDKLTMVLADSLGGNSKTLMIANVSPSDQHLDETKSSLRQRVRCTMVFSLPPPSHQPFLPHSILSSSLLARLLPPSVLSSFPLLAHLLPPSVLSSFTLSSPFLPPSANSSFPFSSPFLTPLSSPPPLSHQPSVPPPSSPPPPLSAPSSPLLPLLLLPLIILPLHLRPLLLPPLITLPSPLCPLLPPLINLPSPLCPILLPPLITLPSPICPLLLPSLTTLPSPICPLLLPPLITHPSPICALLLPPLITLPSPLPSSPPPPSYQPSFPLPSSPPPPSHQPSFPPPSSPPSPSLLSKGGSEKVKNKPSKNAVAPTPSRNAAAPTPSRNAASSARKRQRGSNDTS